MTTDEYIAKLRKTAEDIDSGKALFLATSTLLAAMQERIFTDGKNSDGIGIGEYNDSDPIYVNPITARKDFPTNGKTGKDTFKSGKKHTTGYFESYKSFRDNQGVETKFVNLKLTDELFLNFSSGVRRVNNNEYNIVVTKKVNVDKVDGNEDRFGKIFNATKQERLLVNETYLKELRFWKTGAVIIFS